MSGINYENLVGDFNQYAYDLQSQIVRQVLASDASSGIMTVRRGVMGANVITREDIFEFLQSFQKTTTMKGQVDILPLQIFVNRVKINSSFTPAELTDRYFAKLDEMNAGRDNGTTTEGTPITPQSYPFANFLVDAVGRKVQDEIENDLLFKGEFRAPIAGVASKSEYSTDGHWTFIKKMIKLGKIVPLAPTVTFPEATTMVNLDLALDALNEKYANLPMLAFCSRKLVKQYRRNYRAEYGQTLTDKTIPNYDALMNRLDDYSIDLFGHQALRSLKTFVITPPRNLMKLYAADSDPLHLQKDGHQINLFGSFGLGFGCMNPDWVFVIGEPIEAPRVVSATATAATTATIVLKHAPVATGYSLIISTNANLSSPIAAHNGTQNTTANPVAVDITLPDGTASKEWRQSFNVTGLTANTTYYVGAYSKLQVDGGGALYSSQAVDNVLTFTTPAS